MSLSVISLSALCSGCFIAASAYEDSLALFSRSASVGSDIFDKVNVVLTFPSCLDISAT